MLRPNVAGRLLQALELTGSERVLQIGAGSGFLTACLGLASRSVHAVEIFPELAELAANNLAAVGIRNATVESVDALQLEPGEQYDVVALTASLPAYDERFQRLLRVGGRLFAVIGEEPVMEACLLRCVAEGAWSRESLFETVLDPLVNAWRPREFEF
jgi:protein-L-isoaspartate(D-aspartate) O-methyltransferase